MKIRIAIADDHPMVIDGLHKMLAEAENIEISDTYMNGVELLNGLEFSVPDILLLDIQLPDHTGDELTPVILKKHPSLKILALTNFDSIIYVNNMIRNGAKGYLLKTTSKQTLLEAIDAIYDGQEFIAASLREKMQLQTSRVNRTVSTKSSLTTREKEILQFVVNGNTDQEIAEQLFLSLNSVKHYRKCILLKMDVKNTAALVSKALRMGLAK